MLFRLHNIHAKGEQMQSKKYPIGHYHEGDYYPVKDFMNNELNQKEQGRLKFYSEQLEDHGPALMRPQVEKLKGFTDLWELRPSFWKTEIRIIFTWFNNQPVFLEGFIEKSEGKKTNRHYQRANERKIKLFKL